MSKISSDRAVYLTDSGELYSIGMDGSAPALLAGSDMHIEFAHGCGDGKHIVLQRRVNGQVTVWRMDANGANLAPISQDVSGSCAGMHHATDNKSLFCVATFSAHTLRLSLAEPHSG